MLGQHPGELLHVGGARISQRGIHTVTQLTLETTGCELLAPLLPVRQRAFGGRQGLEAVLDHDLVVQLVQTMRPTRVPGQRATSDVVVIDHVNVGMQMVGVVMHRDEVVSAVHGLGQRTRHLPDPLHVGGAARIELGRREREHIVLELVLATVCPGQSLGTFHEHIGVIEGAGHPRRPCGALHPMPGTVSTGTAVHAVPDRVSRAGGGLHRDRTHRVRSPSAVRRSSTRSTTGSTTSSEIDVSISARATFFVI